MCGSEGTLGIITKVTCRLHPIPEHVSAALCSFASLHEAAEAVTAIRQLGVDVTRLELLDSTSIAAFNQYSSNVPDLPEQPHLFLEFSGASGTAVAEQASLAESICMDGYNCKGFHIESSEEARKKLWAARHVLYYASIALRSYNRQRMTSRSWDLLPHALVMREMVTFIVFCPHSRTILWIILKLSVP